MFRQLRDAVVFLVIVPIVAFPVFWVVVRWGLGPDGPVGSVAASWSVLLGVVLVFNHSAVQLQVDRRVAAESKFLRAARAPDHDLVNPRPGASVRVWDTP